MEKVLFKNGTIFYHDKLVKKDLLLEDNKIIKIEDNIDAKAKIIDISNQLLLPGLVDLHEHLREPGFEHKGTIKSETLSAKHGGYTHIVAMANTDPCMDDVDTIKDFTNRVKKDASVHTYSYSAITTNLEGVELVDMDNIIKENIIVGFSDDGKGLQSKELMNQAMSNAHRLNSIIVAHEEDENELQPGGCMNLSSTSKELGVVGINNASEANHAIRDMQLAIDNDARFHICHISTKETVAGLSKARKTSKKISGEVCPHHLILTDENLKTLNPNYKMNPPLRSKEDLDALIKGLNDGVITCISTDHAPHSEEEKNLPIDKAPFGIIGNQQSFSLVYTYLVKKGLLELETMIRCFTTNPSKVIGFDHEIEVGKDANLCVFDLNEEYLITKESLKSKACNTPFLDTKAYGKLKYIIIDGNVEKM